MRGNGFRIDEDALMFEFLGSVWWLLVTLGLLVTFHEFGHFWVARRLGVRVLRFSIGFGKPLWSRTGADGTEYVIAAIPLGGYVRMLDEREGDVAPADYPYCFNRKPLWARSAIVAAGPLANLLFAVAAFWVMFVVGKPDFLPVVGNPQGLVAEAGLRAGDRLRALDEEPLDTWTQATLALVEASLERRDRQLTVQGASGTRVLTLPFSRIPGDLDEREAWDYVGIVPRAPQLPATIGRVLPDSPAARAGLRADDRILALNGTATANFQAMREALQREAANGAPIQLRIQRGAQELILQARPERVDRGGTPTYQLGIEQKQQAIPYDTVLRYGVVEAFPAALAETWAMTAKTLGFLKHMLIGRASLNNVSGPIGIAQTANFSAQLGIAWFLSFLGLMSLSIGLLNLLPIPILDGGHLLYYLIEWIKGGPVSERVMAAGQYVGLVLLGSLMLLAFYNDLLRLIP